MDNIDPATIQRIMAALQAQGISPQMLAQLSGGQGGTPFPSGPMPNSAIQAPTPPAPVGLPSTATSLPVMPSGPNNIQQHVPMPPRDPRKFMMPGPVGGTY